MNNNFMLMTDSYKLGHHQMLPPNTEYVYSYFEARKGARFPETVFYGLRYLLNRLQECKITKDYIEEAAELARLHFGNPSIFNTDGWYRILAKYNGNLPLRIRAVPEGTVVPINNVLMTVENTDPEFPWLTNYAETFLSRIWYPITVATISNNVRNVLKEFLQKTDNQGLEDGVLNFQLHDFGSRGVSSQESAAIGGSAHLLNFMGTDTLDALTFIRQNYGDNCMGFSVPASEHSIMTAEGKEDEHVVIDRLIKQFPEGILSVVLDSYGYENAITNLICKRFKQAILNRNGTFVCRPDSVTKAYNTPARLMLFTLRELWAEFGGTWTKEGYKLLNPKVRVIWGDGLTPETIRSICTVAMDDKFAISNMVFGMGGGLLQKDINRDTQRFAFKCSAQCQNGQWKDVFKEPTDLSKASKKGKFKLINNGSFETVPECSPGDDLLQDVYVNGKLFNLESFSAIKERIK